MTILFSISLVTNYAIRYHLVIHYFISDIWNHNPHCMWLDKPYLACCFVICLIFHLKAIESLLASLCGFYSTQWNYRNHNWHVVLIGESLQSWAIVLILLSLSSSMCFNWIIDNKIVSSLFITFTNLNVFGFQFDFDTLMKLICGL